MSFWTNVNGNITVSPMGRTQAEKTYILQTILNHLPIVSGSERNMDIYTIQKNGESSICSVDELGYRTNNLIDSNGRKNRGGWLRCQDNYILVIDGRLRDREFDTTLKELNKWLCRLAKRVRVREIMINIKGQKENIFIQNALPYYKMFEYPSWSFFEKEEDQTENWSEYLMWLREDGGIE